MRFEELGGEVATEDKNIQTDPIQTDDEDNKEW